MKKLFFLCAFLISAFITLSQTTYKGSFIIKNLSDNSKLEFYTKAIEKVDFEKYRLQNKNVMLEFRNGFELELISVETLKSKGIVANAYQYAEDTAPDDKYPIFKISDEGIVVTMHHAKLTKQQSKLNSVK